MRRPIPPLMGLLAGVALVALVVGGCGDDPAPASPSPSGGSQPELAGSAWVAISVAGLVPGGQAQPTMAFARSEVSGSSGCNRYGATYTYDGATGALAIAQTSTTLMACGPPQGTIEQALQAVISEADRAALDGEGRLVISGPGGMMVLVNVRQPALP